MRKETMKQVAIHPLWYLCIFVRVLLAIGVFFVSSKVYTWVLLCIGLGFLYKSYTGSNNEYQIAKVFWHTSRKIHALFYLAAAACIHSNQIRFGFLMTDVLFSIYSRKNAYTP